MPSASMGGGGGIPSAHRGGGGIPSASMRAGEPSSHGRWRWDAVVILVRSIRGAITTALMVL